MSDNLISRKEALERLQLLKKFNTTEAMQIAIDVAEQQINFCRTAFDKERVLEEIQDIADLSAEDGLWHVELQETLEIVEKGGLD